MSFTAFALDMGCGVSTVSEIVRDVIESIITELHEEAFPPVTREMLTRVARRTQAIHDYPRAAGFMDGKHICIRRPADSGSNYWNYKHYYSIMLLAWCDTDYRILAYDVGSGGRAGDAGVYRNSAIKEFLESNDEVFPPTRELGTVGPVQYHILQWRIRTELQNDKAIQREGTKYSRSKAFQPNL
ncbi:unnamed protein product [Cylicocyclus nassatus]|uniref:DDE Tnp4 domain-containing protein n=1 Tax=Cylicocyclus nassatus TaxID=53992 RepID=A0AA36H509_CYLNA|nr:unnamed protein product [Cylicocyclus nassatus]